MFRERLLQLLNRPSRDTIGSGSKHLERHAKARQSVLASVNRSHESDFRVRRMDPPTDVDALYLIPRNCFSPPDPPEYECLARDLDTGTRTADHYRDRAYTEHEERRARDGFG